ncbi:zinc-ribbon domain-containing protein [Prosthecobacter sp.]|uniref:zinc-ribbon domain-containing protein n=1 Tax=Prosthecobacter sp. TaxID=1965333 RepID=UPI00378419E9
MIIWGSKAKEARVSTGNFFCPQCMAASTYSHMRVSRYFTLYFIPLFPTSTLGEYVRCNGCQGEMTRSVIQYTREEILVAMAPWACEKCGNRNAPSQSQCLACGGSQFTQPPPLPAPPMALE